MKTIEDITTWLLSQPQDIIRGRVLHRGFQSTERYIVDFAPDFKDGWQQFDTKQDAPYFGVWVHPGKLITLTYAEGDWTLVVCSDKEDYNSEIQSMIDFYEEGFVAITYDETGKTVYRQNRQEFFIT